MNLFDLHCDTASECFKQGKNLFKNDLQFDISKGKNLDNRSQCFAVWVPDEYRGATAEDYYETILQSLQKQVEMNKENILLCKNYTDYCLAKEEGKCAAFLTLEGGSAAFGKGRLQKLKTDGVKLITLTWNEDNEIAGGCQSGTDFGFTPEGRAFVREMDRLHIIADVSHLNRTSFFELMGMETDVPVVASHSDCFSVLVKTRNPSVDRAFSLRRSLTDEQIKLLIARKGLLGINFCNSFLGDPGDDGREAVYRHMSHVLDLGGENILAIGSDFDGCQINGELDSPAKMPALREFLQGKGWSETLLEKIFYRNADIFFVNVLQKG